MRGGGEIPLSGGLGGSREEAALAGLVGSVVLLGGVFGGFGAVSPGMSGAGGKDSCVWVNAEGCLVLE